MLDGRNPEDWELSAMTVNKDMQEEQTTKGGRLRWLPYTPQERSILEAKFTTDWEELDFLETFWNPIYDRRDLLQYRRAAEVWRMRLSGKSFKGISGELGIDQRKACALVSGRNLHPYLVQMYLNRQLLSKPRNGWKWVLDCTPKPTNAFPEAIEVPAQIRSYQDILDFLKQFPQVPPDNPAIKFFGLSSEWVDQHKAELFGFLLGFMVGDAGKDYPEYEVRSRHYHKTAIHTNMAINGSNLRVLAYLQLALQTIGTKSERRKSTLAIRWNSTPNNVLTWIIRVCLGLSILQRTSRNPVQMEWLLTCPKEFLVAFIQGLAESDGSVDKHGYYAAIASVPNSKFFQLILSKINTPSHVYPKSNPSQLRVNLEPSLLLPIFNPVIKSYRFLKMVNHAERRKILPPLPFFSS